jgi:hypothetical protein
MLFSRHYPTRFVYTGFLSLALLLSGCGESEDGSDVPTDETSETNSGGEVSEDLSDNPQNTTDTEVEDSTPNLDDTSLPTWAMCRQMFLDATMDNDTETICDGLYLEAPLERLYGIRFIMIRTQEDQESWLDERMDYMQALFEPEGIRFSAKSIEDFSDTAVPGATGDTMIRVGDAAADIAKFIGVEFTDEETVVEALADTLRDLGVNEMRLRNLSPESQMPDAIFWSILARSDPEHIVLIVTDDIVPGGGSGSKASPPPVDTTDPKAGIVFLNGNSTGTGRDNPMVMAHEMGHYFGLFHTFHQPEGNSEIERCEFEPESREMQFGNDFSSIEPKDALLNYWDLQDSPTEVYLPYDASEEEVGNFEAYRKALTFFGTEHHFSYSGSGDAITSNGEYWDLMESNASVYVKNFIARGVNNCDWPSNSNIIGCEIEGEFILGTDPLLDGTVVFQNGTVGNLMSYISPENSMGADPHDTLHHDQFIVTRITSHSASHQALRNYSLK